MAKATQFCIGLDNRPGMLAKLCATLKRAKVNIEAISVADSCDCCWVRLVASPSATAKKALTKARYNFCTQRVLIAKVENQPGALGTISEKLAKAGVNINYVYASTAKGDTATLVMGVDNLDRAVKTVG